MNALTSTGNSPTLTERHIRRGEYQIYVRDYAGSEPAFVLMHGFPDNLGIYDRLAPLLAEAGHRIVAFDFLGYGGSDKPSEYPYTTKGLEGDLEAVVAALGLDQVVPVGHDASGPTAIDWSLDHEDRVAALALLNCYYDAAPGLKMPELISLFADSAYRALAMAFISDPAQFSWLLQFQARQFLRDAPQPVQEGAGKVLLPVIRSQFSASPSAAPAFISLTRELHSAIKANTERAPRLSAFRRPVRLIWGAGDPYLNAGVAQHLKSLFSNADLSLLKLGHWPQIDGPEEVAKALLALCNRAGHPTGAKRTLALGQNQR